MSAYSLIAPGAPADLLRSQTEKRCLLSHSSVPERAIRSLVGR